MPEFPEQIVTEWLFDAHIDLAPPENIGPSPAGTRAIFIVTGGVFEGPKMRGVYLPGGGDWFLTLANGVGELDVRTTLQTDDGELILLAYRGVLDVSANVVARVFAGEDVDPSEYYFRTAPRFETGSAKYAWLNNTVCVATGTFAPGKVAYRIFAVK
jgi:hypothetical protein